MDLTKAYQSLKTGPIEKNVRRILWRWGNTEAGWEVLAYNSVTFGDQGAALALELAKKIAAAEGVDIDPEAAEVILTSTYVDDTAAGGTDQEVTRFIGNCVDGVYSGTLAQILGQVGLEPKVMVRSGESDPQKLKALGKVLGIK